MKTRNIKRAFRITGWSPATEGMDQFMRGADLLRSGQQLFFEFDHILTLTFRSAAAARKHPAAVQAAKLKVVLEKKVGCEDVVVTPVPRNRGRTKQ